MNKKPQYYPKSSLYRKVILLFIVFISINQIFYAQFFWQKTYHAIPDGDEEAFDICEADSNNYYIGGITAPFFRKAYVIKINQFGDTLWTKAYFNGEIYTLAPTNDGGCIFAGYSGGAFACRIKSNGDTVWVKSYNTINFQDIKKTLDNNYILCGANYSNFTYNGYVCKIDTLGNLIWEKIYPAIFTLDMIRIELATNGGFIVGGKKRNSSGGPEMAYLCKINDTGFVQWEKEYRINSNDIVSGIQTTNIGYILTGWSNDKLYLMKVNENGDSLFTSILNNTSGIYYGPNLLKENNNKYYVSHINGFLASKVYSIDSNLNLIKQITLNHNEGISILSSIKVQNSTSRDIILVGITAFTPGNEDAYALRIDSALTPPPPISIVNSSSLLPEDFILYQNYPNPFNPFTLIKFSLKKSGKVLIKIFDIQGKTTQVFINIYYNTGSYEIRFEGNNLSSGIYFYQLIVNDIIVDTKKMCLLK